MMGNMGSESVHLLHGWMGFGELTTPSYSSSPPFLFPRAHLASYHLLRQRTPEVATIMVKNSRS